jgi:3-oxoacyl-[acyl-carrier protein] reductase
MKTESKASMDWFRGPLTPLEFSLSEEALREFIELTGDRSSLHTDPGFARRSMYRRNVVHGMLPLAYLSCLDLPPQYRYVLKMISGRFLKPLFLNDRLSLTAEVIDVQSEQRGVEIEYALKRPGTGATLTTGQLILGYELAGFCDSDNDRHGGSKNRSCLLVEPLKEQTLRFDQIRQNNEQHLLFRVTKDCVSRIRQIVASGIASSPGGWESVGRLENFDSASLLATCLLSTFVGMVLPGRNATFADFRLSFAKPLQWRKGYKLKGKVRFKSQSASMVVQDVWVHESEDESENYAAGKIDARINELPPRMPTAKSLRDNETDLQLRNKVVLITGASRGIGETTAKLFSAFDAKVVVNYFRGAADAERIVEEIVSAGGDALAIQADVSERQEVTQMMSRIRETYSTVHILVNNAVRDAYPIPFMELDWAEIQKDIDVTVRGTFNCCQEVLPLMMDNGGGKIINIATVFTETPQPCQAKYIISKSALIGLTRSLAVEFAPHNVQVNAVVPSITETDLTRHVSKIFLEQMRTRIPMKRHATVSDVAKAVVTLASSFTSFTTGQKIMVTGGSPPFL